MDKRTRRKAARRVQASRPKLARGVGRISKLPARGVQHAAPSLPCPEDKRTAWLKAHGKCDCIACYKYKPDVMAIYTGSQRYPYRCPYCGSYSPNSREIKIHMGKVPNLMATCPQLQTGVFEAGKIQYRDSGDMRVLFL